MDITGNTLFIPGATSGIGLGLALRFQAAGNTVIVGGRRRALLEQIAAEHPGIGTVEVDITDPASILAARDEVLAAHPQLDAVIAMAGIMLPEDLTEPASLEIAERTVTTNLLGPIRLASAFLPQLIARASAGARPAFVTVSSGLAYVPLPATPTYSATKAAIHSFTDAMRVQLQGTGVQVVELVPPAVGTTLMGLDQTDYAMPLEQFLDEVMALFAADPAAEQIVVDRVRWQRFATAEGRYAEVLEAQSARH
ncbi:SDR family NAD(P)-dependent oxidoreductase [Herbiconiux sp.]|uniref:SDR family oxidoreductase n=1 Tax=Herbiconiux sp. TaxID=1871186 RepID=UPI0025BD200A|nr:SDR family NAD(P)-dependent oxidoreductase [Herbiconiux sp.]